MTQSLSRNFCLSSSDSRSSLLVRAKFVGCSFLMCVSLPSSFVRLLLLFWWFPFLIAPSSLGDFYGSFLPLQLTFAGRSFSVCLTVPFCVVKLILDHSFLFLKRTVIRSFLFWNEQMQASKNAEGARAIELNDKEEASLLVMGGNDFNA